MAVVAVGTEEEVVGTEEEAVGTEEEAVVMAAAAAAAIKGTEALVVAGVRQGVAAPGRALAAGPPRGVGGTGHARGRHDSGPRRMKLRETQRRRQLSTTMTMMGGEGPVRTAGCGATFFVTQV